MNLALLDPVPAWMHGLAQQSLLCALVFVPVACICSLLGSRARRLQAALWGMVFLRLILPLDLASPWSARSLASHWLAAPEVPGGHDFAQAPAPAPAAREGSLKAPASLPVLPWLLFGLWATGAVVSASRAFAGWRRYRRWALEAQPVGDAELEGYLERWRRILGVRRTVRLLESEDVPMAYTMGILRPVVVLPRAMTEDWSPGAVEPVLAHELAHVQRLDALWLFLQGALGTIFFFHPLVRLAGRRLAFCRELLCDDLVLDAGPISQKRYGRSFVAALRLQVALRRPVLPSLAFVSERIHKMRLLAILNHRSSFRPARLGYRALAFAGALLVLPLAPYQAEVSIPATVPAPAMEAASSSPPMVSPLPGGRLTSAFGDQKDPFGGAPRFHQGVDLGASTGTAVRAPAAGKVLVARNEPKGRENFGMLVEIEHENGLRTVFAHLSAIRVEEGARVEAGETVGDVGSTGRSTGPHLHFEIWKGDKALDPASYIKAW